MQYTHSSERCATCGGRCGCFSLFLPWTMRWLTSACARSRVGRRMLSLHDSSDEAAALGAAAVGDAAAVAMLLNMTMGAHSRDRREKRVQARTKEKKGREMERRQRLLTRFCDTVHQAEQR